MEKSRIKITSRDGWTVGYIKALIQHLPNDTKVNTSFLNWRIIIFDLPENYGLEATIKESGEIK